jgi:hypothetical protein
VLNRLTSAAEDVEEEEAHSFLPNITPRGSQLHRKPDDNEEKVDATVDPVPASGRSSGPDTGEINHEMIRKKISNVLVEEAERRKRANNSQRSLRGSMRQNYRSHSPASSIRGSLMIDSDGIRDRGYGDSRGPSRRSSNSNPRRNPMENGGSIRGSLVLELGMEPTADRGFREVVAGDDYNEDSEDDFLDEEERQPFEIINERNEVLNEAAAKPAEAQEVNEAAAKKPAEAQASYGEAISNEAEKEA